MEIPESSLKELFNRSREQHGDLESLDPQSAEFKHTLQSLNNTLERCQQLIQQLSIFSTNEEIEDVSTQDLQYFTVDYSLAELKTRAYGGDRKASLRLSAELLERFLARLDHYRLLMPADRRLYERYLEERLSFRVISSNNPEEKRKIKIRRFQEEKALKQKLEYLTNESRKLNVDDETVRSLYLAEIGLDVNRTFSSLDMISQELDILSRIEQSDPVIAELPPDARAPSRSNGYTDRLDGPTTLAGLGKRGGPLLSSRGKPLQPFTLTDKRSQLQQGVFKPSHNLPTMSIDEYLEEERKRGGIIEGGNTDGEKPELDQDNLAEVDAATMKAREWDEFVEANPKGAGNTLNRG